MAAIRSPGRFLAVGHGLTAPPLWVEGVPALVFGVTTPTASPSLAASDARSVCGLTHPGAVKLLRFRVHTIDRGHSLADITGCPDLSGPVAGVIAPPPSLKRAGGISHGAGAAAGLHCFARPYPPAVADSVGRVVGLDDHPPQGVASPLALAALQRVHRWPGVRRLPPWVRVHSESQGVILACLSIIIRMSKNRGTLYSSGRVGCCFAVRS